MPQPHSELYTKVCDARIAIGKQPLILRALIKEISQRELPSTADKNNCYNQLSDLLRETNDSQFGIVSKLNNNGQWVRDATSSIPLSDRISHASLVIEANNALLRCLSRLRPIDYAILQKYPDGKAASIRAEMKYKLCELMQTILTIAQSADNNSQAFDKVNEAERAFDTFLICQLHKANLTKGCETQTDAKKLLFHYRNLSSLMQPTRTMITLSYDNQAHVFQRDIQYPVTQKTAKQKNTLLQLKIINQHPIASKINAHTIRNVATQEADNLLADLMLADDRALPAQARFTHLVGTKNTFIVKNELIQVESLPDDGNYDHIKPDPDNTLWLARMGIPVYVGKGENDETIQEHTRENLEQIRSTAAALMGKTPSDLKLHLTCLNTYTFLQQQSTMVDHLYRATRKNTDKPGDDISYIPINIDGTFRLLDIAPDYMNSTEMAEISSLPGQKATRLSNAVSLILKASQIPGILSAVNCASGQDRTGTAIEKTTQIWMEQQYITNRWKLGNIQTMRAEGGNASEITSHHVHGSPGMKTDSIAWNLFGFSSAFSKASTDQFYRTSADTNVSNPVGTINFLKLASDFAVEEYWSNFNAFNHALQKYNKSSEINRKRYYEQGMELLKLIRKSVGHSPKSIDAKNLATLSAVLSHCTVALYNRNDKENLLILAGLAQEVEGHAYPGWQKLGLGILTFACLTLVIAGLLAAIPSGGTSLLATIIGVAGLSTTTATGIVIGTGIIGAVTAYKAGQVKGIAKSLTFFTSCPAQESNEQACTFWPWLKMC